MHAILKIYQRNLTKKRRQNCAIEKVNVTQSWLSVKICKFQCTLPATCSEWIRVIAAALEGNDLRFSHIFLLTHSLAPHQHTQLTKCPLKCVERISFPKRFNPQRETSVEPLLLISFFYFLCQGLWRWGKVWVHFRRWRGSTIAIYLCRKKGCL